MGVKRYGPVNDAGTVIKEKEGEPRIELSALGSTAYTGVLERGGVGVLISTSSKRDLIAKTGGFIPDSLVPDAAQDFWQHGEGAGVLFLYRVTDGNEVVATTTLYDRKLPRNPVVRVDAENGGKWAGKRDTVVADLDAVPTDITGETTVKLPDLYVVKANKWKGGTITFTETGDSYEIVSNTEGDGVTGAVVTVTADAKMLTDFGAGTDVEITLKHTQVDVWGRTKNVSVKVKDGQLSPSTTWGLEVYLDDDLVKVYPDLSSDPLSADYFVDIINNDSSNYYIEVTDLWTGAITAAVRPANQYGVIPAAGIAEKVLTLADPIVDMSGANLSTITGYTYGANVVRDTLTLTRGAVDWAVTSAKFPHVAFPDAVDATPYVADNPYSFGFTVGGGTPANGDVIIVHVEPLVQDEAIGGTVYPDVDNAPNSGFAITDNDETSVTISSGDMTTVGVAGENYRVEYKQQLEFGFDGNVSSGLVSTDFDPAFDVNTSPFNDTAKQGYGLIKHGCPGVEKLTGVTASTVHKAGAAYAQAKNHQYRYEITETITDEFVAKSYVQDTLGRNDYVKVTFPSYCDVADPILRGRLKEVPTMGMIHGREAREARNYLGYHKVAAGEDVTFPKIRDLPTGDRVLNGEILNPAGIQRIVIAKGNYIHWGARAPFLDPSFTFVQHRETLSQWEQTLQDAFDWIIFAINDKLERPRAISALKSFFKPEYVKRALDNDFDFTVACVIKVDEEINTPAIKAAGKMQAEVTVRIVDTVEQFVITIGRAGIFETTAPA